MNWNSFLKRSRMIQHPLPPVSEAAFCRARQKLKPEALVTLNNVLLDSANQQIAQQRWRGLRVLAVDGSTGRLPDFLAIEEYFGKPSGSGVPLARFFPGYSMY